MGIHHQVTRHPRRVSQRALLAAWAVLLVASAGCGPDEPAHPELVAAGAWLKPYVQPTSLVYSASSRVAEAAGGTHRDLPTGSYEQILDAIVAGRGDWLILGEGPLGPGTDTLLPLLMDKAVAWNDPRLRPVYIDNKSVGKRVLVFRVDRPGGPVAIAAEKEVKPRMSILTHTENHKLHGMLAMRGSRWAIAAGEFAYVVERDSTDAVSHNNRAWCVLQTGQWLHMAEEHAHKAVALDPSNADFLDTLIQVLRAAQKPDEAAFFQARLDSLLATPQ